MKSEHVLVVDDQQANIELFEAMLSEFDYRVTAAADGIEALEVVDSDPPDLIIMDIMMPRLDGLAATRKVKERPESRSIPVLLVTGLSDTRDRVKGLEAGADDFLGKPFTRVELVARVRSLLRIKALHDELEQKNALLYQVLNRYVSEEVAEEVLRDPERNLKLGGHSCVLSVLFADIRGFTPFSEKRPATEVVEVLNEVFSALSPVIFEYHGTLDKFLGDAIMAFFGAPISGHNDAERAVRAARAMQVRFAELSRGIAAMKELALGIGICTGEAVVGNIGSERMMDYTVIGNIPNTASRLQSAASGGQILIDHPTYEAVRDIVTVTPTAPLVLKGRSEPLHAYEVLGLEADHPERARRALGAAGVRPDGEPR
ncbi:MAG: adenylate/guanylate cyclase domain-containing protein [Gammaproteobacteria bacterium]|nr:adenylate/guanylate cyclase domain-containing protein [Gammaproteobacteria bacterium]